MNFAQYLATPVTPLSAWAIPIEKARVSRIAASKEPPPKELIANVPIYRKETGPLFDSSDFSVTFDMTSSKASATCQQLVAHGYAEFAGFKKVRKGTVRIYKWKERENAESTRNA